MNDQEFYRIENCQAFQKTNNGKIKQRLPRKGQMQEGHYKEIIV